MRERIALIAAEVRREPASAAAVDGLRLPPLAPGREGSRLRRALQAARPWSLLPALAGLLGACGPIAEGQYREAMQFKVREAQSAYETARAKGDNLAMCTCAGLVAAAYTDARDPANAGAWTARRREDCAQAQSTVGAFWDQAPTEAPARR